MKFFVSVTFRIILESRSLSTEKFIERFREIGYRLIISSSKLFELYAMEKTGKKLILRIYYIRKNELSKKFLWRNAVFVFRPCFVVLKNRRAKFSFGFAFS